MVAYLQSIDQTLIDAGRKTLERMLHTLTNFENRVLKARQERERLRTEHLEQIHRAIFPDELPQERYMGIVYYLNKFGPSILDKMFEKLDCRMYNHQTLNL